MRGFAVYAREDDLHPAVDADGREQRGPTGPDFPQTLSKQSPTTCNPWTVRT